MKMKFTAAAAALLLGASTLTACTASGSTQPAGDVNLRMTIWSSNEAHLKLFNEIAASYLAEHPTVKTIKFEPIAFDSYTSTLTTQIAGGNPPDMAWIFESSAPDFVSSGALKELTPTLKDTPGYQLDDVGASATALWTKDNKLFAYPFSSSPFVVFANTDLLAQAGHSTVDAAWTWDDALKIAADASAKTGKAGLVVRDFDYKNWDNLASVWRGWGADPWSEDGKTCAINSPQMVAALTAFHTAAFGTKAVPAPGTAADFFAGDAAMTITQISRASLLKDAKFKWNVLPLPTGNTGKYSVIGQAGIGVLAKSPHADEAAKFVAYLTNPTNAAKLSAYFPPPRTSLLTTENLAATNPLLTKNQLSVVVDAIKTGRVKPSHTGYAEINQQVRAGLDPLWTPGAQPQQVLNDICGKITPLLGK